MGTEHEWVAFDFETTGANKYACGIVLGVARRFDIRTGRTLKTFYYTCPEDTRKFAQELASPRPKVAHNMSFDLHIAERRLGLTVRGEIHDTYLMAKHWRNDLPCYDLKSLAWHFEGDLYPELQAIRDWMRGHGVTDDESMWDMSAPPAKLVRAYCTADVRNTAALAHRLVKKLKTDEPGTKYPAYRIDCECIRHVVAMEDAGIVVDMPFLRKYRRNTVRRIRYNMGTASEKLGAQDGRKPTGKVLRDRLAQLGETRKTASGMVRADDVVLNDWKGEDGVASVARVRTDQKLFGTYVRNILAVAGDGKFHPGFIQSGAITRRFRCAGLYGDDGTTVRGQVQNCPRGPGIRTAFIVPPGYKFLKRDLASIEARLAAHAMSVFLDFDFYCRKYAEDDRFNIYLFVIENHTKHGKVSKKDPLYTAYKHACLGIQYGVGIDKFHQTLTEGFRLPYSYEECNAIYRTIRHECPEFGQLQRAVSNIVDRQGYIVDDFGSVYYVPSEDRYKGVNYYCQGCAGMILKWWWIQTAKLMRKFGNVDWTFNTVHDEFDDAIKNDSGAEARAKAYTDVVRNLDLFDLPIVAESSGLVDNWAQAG